MQNTLDAFGVGFIVGGVIDVLAISGLNRAAVAEQERLENERRRNDQLAKMLLEPPIRGDGRTYYVGNDPRSREVKALKLMQVPEDQLDPGLRAELVDFVYSVEYEEREKRRDFTDWIDPNAPCPCASGHLYKRCHGDPRSWPVLPMDVFGPFT